MRSRCRHVCSVVLLLLIPVVAVADLGVRIVEPRHGEMAIGTIDVIADTWGSETVHRVEFRVDGRLIAELVAPPYIVQVDLGPDNVRHRLEVIAHGASGTQSVAEVVTEPIPMGGELDLDLQQLYVTVESEEGRVAELSADQFMVSDNGKSQQLVTFEEGNAPFTAVLLIDSSISMVGAELEGAWKGASHFIQNMRELDEVKVLAYSERILGSTPFTDVADVLTGGLGGIEAQGGTAVADHMYVATKLLEARQGRRVVILLSDGVDTHSIIDMEDVVENARRDQVLVYWVRLAPPIGGGHEMEMPDIYSSWCSPAEHRRRYGLLRQMVEASGGRVTDVSSADQIEPVFIDILHELREQYVLGYYPSDHRNDGGWHRVRVKIRAPGHSARTHEGYYDR